MSDLALLPDIEELTVRFLLDQGEVIDFFDRGVDVERKTVDTPPTDRVYSELPRDKVFPLVRVTRIGGVPSTRKPRYLDHPVIQIDVLGDGRRLTFDLAETCGAVIAARITGVYDQGIVTGADVNSPLPADSAFPKIFMRRTIATLHTHPLPASGS